MKKALISPIEPRQNGFRVAEVADQEFEVATPFFWVDCEDQILADAYWYDPDTQQFIAMPLSELTLPQTGDQPVSTGAQTL